MPITRRPSNPLRAAILRTAQPSDPNAAFLAALRAIVDAEGPTAPVRSLPRWTGPTIGGRSIRQLNDEKELPLNDTEPLAQHGVLNALFGHGATKNKMPSMEDVGSMSPALGIFKQAAMPFMALKDLIMGGNKNMIGAGLADLPRRTRSAPMVIMHGKIPEAVGWEMPHADDIAPSVDELAQHLETVRRTWPEQTLPFSPEDSRAGIMENKRVKGLEKAVETVMPPYVAAANEARYEFLRDNNIPMHGSNPTSPLPRMTDGPPVFVHPSVSEWEANDLMKAAQRGMDISRELAPTPSKVPSTISIDPGGVGGSWNDYTGELTINRGDNPAEAVRTGAHEMRHAWQYGDKVKATELIDPEIFKTPYVPHYVDYPGYRAHPQEVDAWATGNVAELIDTSRSQGQGVLDPQYLLEIARAYERQNADLMRQQAILRTKQPRPAWTPLQFGPYEAELPFPLTPVQQQKLERWLGRFR